MDRTGPQVHVAPVRCPFCHEGIPKGEAPAVCAECHALHHVACMNEHGACAACGRKRSPSDDSRVEVALRARASARLDASERVVFTPVPVPAARRGLPLWPFPLTGLILGVVLAVVVGRPWVNVVLSGFLSMVLCFFLGLFVVTRADDDR